MTKEEYEQCKIDQFSDDPCKAIQAKLILRMFPTEETKYAINSKEDMEAFMNKHVQSLRELLGEIK